jgi:hypothetical protein
LLRELRITTPVAGKASSTGQIRSGQAVNASLYARRPLPLRPTVLTESVRPIWLGMALLSKFSVCQFGKGLFQAGERYPFLLQPDLRPEPITLKVLV